MTEPIVSVNLSMSKAKMLLEMFSIIESFHPLAGDMAELYADLKHQIVSKI